MFNKTKDQLWSLNAAQPVGNVIVNGVIEKKDRLGPEVGLATLS